MPLLSIIIPARREPFLNKTIESLLENSTGDTEIIAVLDGDIPTANKTTKWSTPERINDPRVTYLILPQQHGMRGAFNTGLEKAQGEYVMKLDAHCLFAPGFDTTLINNCEQNWLLIPRRYSLQEVNWIKEDYRGFRDYHYLTFPGTSDPSYGLGMHGKEWPEMTKARSAPTYDLDDLMSFQGSCWVAQRKFFDRLIGKLDDNPNHYGGFAQEPQELGLKYWLSGGEVKICKKTWYAHLSKRSHHYARGLFSRRYKKEPAAAQSHTWSTKHWLSDEEQGTIHPFSWLITKFWPVPSWPLNWQEAIKSLNL